ncbi:amidase [Pseudonocardia nematodicida]|uniref:Amidase n=1 Tax=Pseudonocardia nematodicida TaxID=1206997 RepID=A0ABV1KJ85_9PSEU
MTARAAHDVVAYDPSSFEGLQFHRAVDAFRSGTDTPRDYLERCLATIAEREPVVRAWAFLDEEGARRQADSSTGRWRDGRALSPVDGMPIGVKDVVETKDMPTEYGCAAFSGNFPRRDNAAVAALRQAGAVIVGKTTTAELGGPQPPATTNPFHSGHTPGGSSSGSGAAVGAQMVPACFATQSASSLLRPASFNGNWGLKPSQGAVNRGERQAGSTAAHGAVAACPEDMWHVAIAMAGRAGGDPGWPALRGPGDLPPAHRPFTVAVMETEGWPDLDPASHEAFEQVVEQVRAHGVTVLRREDAPVERFERALVGATALTTSLLAWEYSWAFRPVYEANPQGVSERGRQFFLDRADEMGPAGYEAALQEQNVVKQAYVAVSGRVDAVLSPASAGPAPAWDPDVPAAAGVTWPTGNPAFGTVSSLLGAPAVNAPLMSVRGLPYGVQVMGRHGDDARVTAIAHWLREIVTPVVL